MSEPTGSQSEEHKQPRAFTIRAIVIGLIGAAIAAAVTPVNDEVLKQTNFIGHSFALFAFFFIFVLAWVWNPVFARVCSPLVLRTRELIVVLGMTLCSCWVVGSGLFRLFFTQLILPWNQAPGEKQWEKYDMLGYLPNHMFPLGKDLPPGQLEGYRDIYQHPDYERVYGNFVTGGADVPWDAWLPILFAWAPLIVVFAVALIALSLVVHRQWARNEQLAYPLAQIGRGLLERDDAGVAPKLARSRLFWGGALFVFGLQMIRLWHHWYPTAVPDIPLNTGFGFMWSLVPNASQAGLHHTHAFHFYFLLFAIAYFVSSEIALTLGLSQLILVFVGVEYYIYTGTSINPNQDLSVMRAGSYVMYGLAILFVGRHYYWGLLKRAFGKRMDEEDQTFSADGVLAARVFLAAFAVFWILLVVQFELDWLIALVYALMAFGLFLVLARIICETGMPYMQAAWSPGIVLSKLFGFSAIGAAPLIITYYIGSILTVDPRTSLMPYANTSFHIADGFKVRLRKLAMVALLAVCGALVVGTGARLWKNYEYGGIGPQSDGFARAVSEKPFNSASNAFVHLEETGQLGESPPGLAKLAEINPDSTALGFFLAGMVCVAVFFALRLRFMNFPLHPVLFLVWGTWPMSQGFWSFLLGWACKELVVRFGGGKVYQDLKPIFFGLIVGELVAAMTGIGIGFIYYWVTGETPEAFRTFIA